MNVRKNSGLTLIELLVVISIIGMLSSVVIASLNTVRKSALNTTIVSTVRQFVTLLQMYRADTGLYPDDDCGGPQCRICRNASDSIWPPVSWPSQYDLFPHSIPYLVGNSCLIYHAVNNNPVSPYVYYRIEFRVLIPSQAEVTALNKRLKSMLRLYDPTQDDENNPCEWTFDDVAICYMAVIE